MIRRVVFGQMAYPCLLQRYADSPFVWQFSFLAQTDDASHDQSLWYVSSLGDNAE